MTALAPLPPALASPVAASLSREERALASFLRTDILAAFARTGDDDERRVDLYLKLNEVLRLDDTLGSVRVLQHFLPHLLHHVHADLKRETAARDAVHLALRTLSYFVFHATLSAFFPDRLVDAFLADLTSRLASTQDEVTYKLCVWCLSVQTFDLARLDFLPRIVEALVLAIINPFQSRPIAVQAIKGLHLLTSKFKTLMLAQRETLSVWFKPVASRLASSDRTTRHHAALALQEVALFATTHDMDDDVVAGPLVEYAVPAMQTHVTHERPHDALIVWKLVMVLMRRKLATDVALMNEMLSVAEPLLRHTDASVRLQGIEAWRHVVGVFRVNREWVFDRSMVAMPLGPIVTCIETETGFNVLHAAMATWRVIVGAAVEDFNAFCEAQGRSGEAIQQSAKKIKWKRWLEDVVRKVVVAGIEKPGQSHKAVHDAIESTVRALFSTVVVPSDSEMTTTHSNNALESSVGSSTTAASTVSELQSRARVQPGMDLSERDDELLDAELLHYSASASLGEDTSSVASTCKPLSSRLLALAIVLPDVLKIVKLLGQRSSGSELEQRCQQLGLSVWDGFCSRLATQGQADDGAEKMRLRLLRFCLDFTFDISQSLSTALSSMDSQASVLVPSLQTDAVMTAVDLINGAKQPVHSTQAFRWQLRLLHQVVSISSSADELNGLFQHPKSRIAQHLLSRVDRIVELNDVYREWLAPWDQQAVRDRSEVRIDFSAKSSTLVCVLLYLALNLALSFDAEEVSTDLLGEVTGIYVDVMRAVQECEALGSASSLGMTSKFCDYVRRTPDAAKALLENESSVTETGAGRLLKVCDRLTRRSEETEENAEALLQLRSPVKQSSPQRTTTNTSDLPSPAPTRGVTEDPQSAVSTGSDTAVLPCLLQSKRNVLAAVDKLRNTASSSPPPRLKAAAATTPSRATSRAKNAPPPPPPTPQTPMRSKKLVQNAPSTPCRTPSATPSRSATIPASTPDVGPVFPDLVDSTEPIANLFTHLPFSFRQTAPFHKIETVGHLASMSAEQVTKIGVKDSVVRKALAEYEARRARARLPPGINSPFRQRLQPPPAKSPGMLPSPSPKRILKRPSESSPSRLPVAPLPFESPQHRKRARRSLIELSSDGDGAGHEGDVSSTNTTPSSEQRVKFRLDTKDGASRITCPGSDSQDVSDVKQEKETPQEKMESLILKMDQHLQRSLHYANKIAEEEEKLHSLSASFGDEMRTAHDLMNSLRNSVKFVTNIGARLSDCMGRSQDRRDAAGAKDGSGFTTNTSSTQDSTDAGKA